MSMEPVAAKAHELPWQEQEAAELREELHLMKTAGIIEVAVRNPSVAEYMAHWEGRATDAEARIADLERERDVWRAKSGGIAVQPVLDRVAELEAALDEKEIASGLTSYGNLWRFWSTKAKGVAVKLAAAEARAEAAEALLKEAGTEIERVMLFGGRMANACYNISRKLEVSSLDKRDLHFAQLEWDAETKAARSIAAKIGGKDE